MSDQIPIWIMLQASRQLYAKGEIRKRGEKNKDAMKQLTGQTHESQKLRPEDVAVFEEDEEQEEHEGMGQSRGQGITEQGRQVQDHVRGVSGNL